MAQLCLGLATSHLAHIVNARHLGRSEAGRGVRCRLPAARRSACESQARRVADHLGRPRQQVLHRQHAGLRHRHVRRVFRTRSNPRPGRSASRTARCRAISAFARYLVERGLDEGVDWAVTESWEVDHGFMVPLFRLDPEARFRMVPIFINCAAPPLPSPKRCYAVGRWLADVDRPLGRRQAGGDHRHRRPVAFGRLVAARLDRRGLRSPLPQGFLRRARRGAGGDVA